MFSNEFEPLCGLARMIFKRIVPVLVTVSMTGSASVAANLSTREALAQQLQRLEQAHDAIETTFTVTAHYSYPLSESVEPEGFFGRSRVRWLRHGATTRIETTRLHSDGATDAQSPGLVGIWDGARWISHAVDAGKLSYYRTPKLDYGSDCIAWFNGVDWPGIGGCDSLSETILHGPLLEFRSTEDGCVCRVRIDKNKISTLEIHASIVPRFHVTDVIVELSSKGKGNSEPVLNMRVAYSAEDWREYDGLWLPERAVRYGESFLPGNEPIRGRVVFERESAHDLRGVHVDPVLLDPPRFEAGMTVIDRTARLNYRIGEPLLLADGAIINLEKPVVDDPMKTFPELMQGNAYEREAASWDPERLTYQATRWLQALVAGCCMFIFVIVVARVVRRIRIPNLTSTSGRFCLFVLILLAATAVTMMSVLRSNSDEPQPIFSGALKHDFGVILIQGEEARLAHSFELVNVSGRTLQVEGVTTSCGCTDAEVSTKQVRPGEKLSVSATLRLRTARRRVERVVVKLGDGGIQILQLIGTGRRAHDLRTTRYAVPASVDLPQEITLIATSLSDTILPEDPRLDAPDGVSVTFIGWDLVFPFDKSNGRPTRWHGKVIINQPFGEETRPSGALRINPGDTNEIVVDLSGRSWHSAEWRLGNGDTLRR